MDGSIWIDPHNHAGKTLENLVSTYACELRVCEDLLTLGYVFSNHVRLSDRKAWLENKIGALEREIRLLGRKGHK